MTSIVHCRFFLVCACVILAPTFGAAQSTPQEIVDQFYPTNRLSADPGDRETCFAVHTIMNGEPTVIIAGYTDREEGVVRALTRGVGGAFGVGYEVPVTYEMAGRSCVVNLVDVDFDGQLESLVTFDGHGGATGWLFRWNGTELTNLTPTENAGDHEHSELFSPNLIDATHAGWMQIFCPGSVGPFADNEPIQDPHEIYEATDGVYARTRFVLGVRRFRVGSDPRAKVFHFRRSQDSVGPFRFRVTNGDRNGQHRVTTGTITLNGTVVLPASQFTNASEFLEVARGDLPIENTIIISLTGDDDATITVTVTDSTIRVP